MLGHSLRRVVALSAVTMFVLIFITYYTTDSISSFSTPRVLSSIPWLSSQKNTTTSLPSPSTNEEVYNPASNSSDTPSDLLQYATKGPDGNYYPPQYTEYGDNKAPRVKAGFIVLVRNSELDAMKKSMKQVEDRFNKNFKYPWIFLNSK